MSQGTTGRTELEQERESTSSFSKRKCEAGSGNEALGHDASNFEATSTKLEALTSYIDAARQRQNYVSEWLYHRSDSESGRSAHSVSPMTVIEISASSDSSKLDGGHHADTRLDRIAASRSSTSPGESSTASYGNMSLHEHPSRPRSQSQSRDEVTSPRSQRPRSPSPVRPQSSAAFANEEAVEDIARHPIVHATEERLSQRPERPLRPRSPSPARGASPSDAPSQAPSRDYGDRKLSPTGQNESAHVPVRLAGAQAFNIRQNTESTPSPVKQGSESKGQESVCEGPQATAQIRGLSVPLDLKIPSPGPGTAHKTLPTERLHSTAGSSTPREDVNGRHSSNDPRLREAPQPAPPFVPIPPPPDVTFHPLPMMPAVFNIARSLAGARPRRRFSEPSKSAALRSRAAQTDVDHDTGSSKPSYTDSSTQTSDAKDKGVMSPRTSGQSIASITSNASRGTQTSERSSLPLSTTSSGSLLPVRPQKTTSFSAQNDTDSYSSNSSLRQSLKTARLNPSPKKPPPSAKSTRISRILVNSEALSFMQLSHEVYDDYIVVHRILTREEIMELAELTIDIREARSKGAEARERMWEQWRGERYYVEAPRAL